MTTLPTFEVYGDYSNRNYGAHALRFFDADENCYWFSYTTLVAFAKPGYGRVVRQNEWGPTTGKHLNAIDGGDKRTRVNSAEFSRRFAEAFGRAVEAA